MEKRIIEEAIDHQLTEIRGECRHMIELIESRMPMNQKYLRLKYMNMDIDSLLEEIKERMEE